MCSTSAADLGLRCHNSCVPEHNKKKKTQRLHSELALLFSLQVSAYWQPQPLIIEVVIVSPFF